MAYTPNNNPYIAGDPFSYDLKWLVRKIKEHDSVIEGLPAQIQAAVIAALDQHDPVYYSTAAELIASGQKPNSIAYIEGFYNAGDNGANLYYITDDYNDILSAIFYITLGANLWAVPIVMTPFVTPEMFGAAADGITDDKAAFSAAISYNKPIVLNNSKNYLTSGLNINKSIIIYGNGATLLQAPEVADFITVSADNVELYDITFDPNAANQSTKNCILRADNISSLYVSKCDFKPQYVSAYDTIGAVYFTDCTKVKIEDCTLAGAGAEGLVFGAGCSYCSVIGGEYYNNTYGSGLYCYSGSDHCSIIGVNSHDNGGSNIGVIGDYHTIRDCQSSNGLTYGMTLGHPPTEYAVNCIVDNCVFSNNAQRDIVVQMSGTKDNVISNCKFIGASIVNTNYGVSAASTPGRLTVENCFFTNHRYAIGAAADWCISNNIFDTNYIDIFVGGATDNVYLNNNKSASSSFFIALGASAANGWAVVNNIITGSLSSALSFASCIGAIISSNKIIAGTGAQTAINITAGSGNMIANNYISDFVRGIYDVAADMIIGNQAINNSIADYTIPNAVINANNVDTNGPV